MRSKKIIELSSNREDLLFDVDKSDKGYIFQAWLFIYGISVVIKLYTYVDENYIIECINGIFQIITIMYGIVLIKSQRKSNKEFMYNLREFEYRIIKHIQKSDSYIDEIGDFVHDSLKIKKKKTLFC